MTRDARIRSAARVAKTFRIDPVMVLDAPPFEWLVRIASHNIVAAEEAAAADKASKSKG